MAAGLGFKTFNTGDVLSAADVNGYLMQGILVFADATARDAAITSPEEGQFAFLKDTNVTTYYTGSAWANVDTTGMTNPMTTTGDVIYSSSGSTPARLGIGTAGQVLQVNSGATAPEWATPATTGFVGVQAYRVAGDGSLTIAAFTDTAIPFPTENYDTDAFHSTSTNTSRFTVPAGKGGKYLAIGGGIQTVAPADFFEIKFLVNGAAPSSIAVLARNQNSRNLANNSAFVTGSQILNLSVSDYVEFAFRSGSAVTSSADAWFNLVYLGA